jgi:hypothetical protein
MHRIEAPSCAGEASFSPDPRTRGLAFCIFASACWKQAKLADMILLAADPLAATREKSIGVLKGGEILDPGQLLRGLR